MKQISKLTFAVALLLLLEACSWQEYFIIKNNSTSDIVLTYTLTVAEGFPLFDATTTAYSSKSSGEIDWAKTVHVEDQDTSLLGLQFTLPPKCNLVIGYLHNDRYSNAKQQFINNRVFNFERMEIKKKDGKNTITKDNFDSYFKKNDGIIKYEIN